MWLCMDFRTPGLLRVCRHPLPAPCRPFQSPDCLSGKDGNGATARSPGNSTGILRITSLETIKLLSASPALSQKHFVIDNPEVMEDFHRTRAERSSCHLGHLFGWEVANVAMPLLTRFTFLVAYMPVENKVFERLFLRLRGRNGTVLLPATRMQRAILPYRNHTVYALALVADQAPGGPENSYWLNFFGRPTAFIRGAERGARIGISPPSSPGSIKAVAAVTGPS
jgi:hypothetical protein